jgi:hypothetical protein
MKKTWFKLAVLALALVLALSGCPSGGGGDDEGNPGQAAAPVASPPGGTYPVGLSVTLSSATSGADIWYTTDGSVPAQGSGTRYTGPVSVTAQTTIKAIAVKAGMTDSETLTAAYTTITPQRTNASIKNTFAITQSGTAGVSAAFYAVSVYLHSKTAAQLVSENLIRPGDYIDLEGGLTVAPYSTGSPANAADGYTEAQKNGEVNAANTQIPGGDRGMLLRLIVVGINSFNAKTPYTGNTNGQSAHLVFQFQNVPALHRMNNSDTNVGGYKTSEMRTYLTVNFYNGLVAAGVPGSVIYAPKRYVSQGGNPATGADLIEDKLWLPTEREMFGARTNSDATHETDANQARLEYYGNGASRIKYGADGTNWWYWLASPDSGSAASFCSVFLFGYAGLLNASAAGGCAPAFCVR